MKIANVSVSSYRMGKIKYADNPLSVRILWEKIKNWFGFGMEKIVIPLIKQTFFDSETSELDRITGFIKLKNLTGDAYKKNFLVERQNKEIIFSIMFKEHGNDEKISFTFNVDECEYEKKYSLGDSLFNAVNTVIEKEKININSNEIEKDIVIELIRDNKNKLTIDNTYDKDYILKNKVYKKAEFKCEEFTDRLGKVIEHEETECVLLLEKIENELFRDLSRMALTINGKAIADPKNKPIDQNEYEFKDLEFKKLKNEFVNLDDADRKIIYSLLYQKGLLEFKTFLLTQDLFAGMVNIPYSSKTAINVIKDDKQEKIIIEIENKKLLQDENIKSPMELKYVNEPLYNLSHLFIDKIVERPLSLEHYFNALEMYPDIFELLNIGSKFTLEDKTKLIFEYALKTKTLILDNKSEYEYAILKY